MTPRKETTRALRRFRPGSGLHRLGRFASSLRGRSLVVLPVLALVVLGGSGLLLSMLFSSLDSDEQGEDRIIELVGKISNLDHHLAETVPLAVGREVSAFPADRIHVHLSRHRDGVEELMERAATLLPEKRLKAFRAASLGLEDLYAEASGLVRTGNNEEAAALLESEEAKKRRGTYEEAFAVTRAALFERSHAAHTMKFNLLLVSAGTAIGVALACCFVYLLLRQRRSEHTFLSGVLESIPHPLRVIDPDTYAIVMTNSAGAAEAISDASACYAALHGLSRPCDEADRPCPMAIVEKTARPANILHCLEGDDGRKIWRDVHAYPILDRHGNVRKVIEHHLDVTHRKRVEQELENRARALEERVKELNCLYRLSQVTEGLQHDPALVCQEVVRILPPAWQYPPIAQARVQLGGKDYRSEGYRESRWSMRSEIRVRGRAEGFVEVLYTEPMPEGDEGPFLKEERSLLDAVAARLGEYARERALHEALASSEERWKQVVDHANDAIFVIQDARMVFHNRKTEELIGRTREELESRTFVEFIAPEDQEMVVDRYMRRTKGEEVDSTYSFRVIHGSGEALWAEINSVHLVWNSQPAVLCFVRDITERSRMVQRVEESEEKLRCITGQAQDAIVMMDGDGNISFWNEAAERTFGYETGEVLGQNLHRLIAPERFHEKHLAAFPRFQKTGGGAAIGKTLELAALKKSGEEIPVELSLSAVKLQGRWNAIGVLREITDRKRMEEDLRASKERAEKMNLAKSQFLANMSHEIRTPLNGIIGMTGLALKTELNDEQIRYLEAVKTSSDHLLQILNDILDLSKVEAKRLEVEEVAFDLRSALEFTLDQVAFKAHEKGLELLSDLPPDLPVRVVGDPGRLRQVVLNVLNNAVKFTEAGEVKLSCSAATEEDGLVDLRFVVSDTGIGIPEDRLGSIFEPFQQADGSMTRRFGGTGLGLPISKALCEQMGGGVRVESAPGKGTSFHFSVRLGLQPDPRETPLEAIRDRLQGKRLLIVDDNTESRRILRQMVEPWGLVSYTAGSGEAALRLLEDAAAEDGRVPDLLLVDARMPGMDGYALSRRIGESRRLRQCPILLLSEMQVAPPAGDAGQQRIVATLSKPVRQSELYNVLLDVMVGKGHADCHGDARENDRRAASDPPEQRLCILLVEDNHINQLMAKKTLEMFGHEVTIAENGREAVERVAKDAFDIVLMDGQMPVMDGLEATRIIRSRESKTGGRIPILAMTAHAMKGDRERFLSAGMDDYISKPIDPERLRKMLERWGKRRQREMAEADRKGEDPECRDADVTDAVPVNLEKALARACGDKAFLEEMIHHFVGEINQQLERLESVLEAGDAGGLVRQAHSLKGSAATLGAAGVASVALQLEESGKREELSEGKTLLSKLADEMARLSDYVNRPDWLEAG